MGGNVCDAGEGITQGAPMTTTDTLKAQCAEILRLLGDVHQLLATRRHGAQDEPECCGCCLHPRRESGCVGGATERDHGAGGGAGAPPGRELPEFLPAGGRAGSQEARLVLM